MDTSCIWAGHTYTDERTTPKRSVLRNRIPCQRLPGISANDKQKVHSIVRDSLFQRSNQAILW